MRATFGRYLPLIGVLCGILSPCALGNELLVPSQYATIQAGIDAAVAGDTVLVADGTYTGTGNKDLDFHGKAITVRSASGNPSTCIIDCQGSGRGFYFHSGETAAATVAGFTVRHGKAAYGGAVYCSSSSPTLANCMISGNTVSSTGAGGGVYCTGSSPTIVNCTISNNTAHDAGGLECASASSPTLTNCTISENSVTYYGGALYCASSSPTLINCTISGNTAGYEGAGVWCYNASSPTLTNCTISGNAVLSGSGGGVRCYSGCNPSLTNCTISGNTASGGGAVHCYSASPTLTNCVLWGDASQEIYVSSGATPIVTHCDVQGGYAGTGNINVDPGFAFANDFHLMPGSPCIDTGTNAPPGGLAAQDGDGNPRPLDGNGDGQAVADMGAYEFNRLAPAIALHLVPVEFFIIEGQTAPQTQTLFIRNAGGETLNWTVTGDAPWLQASPLQGTSAAEVDAVTLTASGGGLSHAVYSAMLTLSAPQAVNSPRQVAVLLYVGRTLHVPSDYPTIQAAIDAAVPGGEVVVADGTYTGTGNRNLDSHGKMVTVRSASGRPAACIIDCQGSGNGFTFYGRQASAAVVAGLTIRGANTNYGGAVDCVGSSPTLTSCMMSGNTANYGGAVYCFAASPTLTNCVLSGNRAFNYGGALYCNSSASNPTLTNCTITGNRAGSYGGAVDCVYSANPAFINCILWGDTPLEVFPDFGPPTMAYCDVQGGYAGTGNINVDPRFADSGDYHLVAGSPCVDAGTNTPSSGLPAQDADGNPRPQDGDDDNRAVVDMGAYEFDPGAPIIALGRIRFEFFVKEGQGDPQPQALSIRNGGGGTLSWTLGGGAPWLQASPVEGESAGEADVVTLAASAATFPPGVYSTTLTVFAPQALNSPRHTDVVLYVGATRHVPSDYPTIQAAIDAALPGDEVLVADGTYSGGGNRDLDIRGKIITVRSASGNPAKCTIDCQGSGRGFYFHSGETAAATVSGITIANGVVTASSPGSARGGGVYCYLSSPTLSNCTIRGNTASTADDGGGGAVYCLSSSTILTNCTITGNTAAGGAGFSCTFSNPTLVNCTISENHASGSAGGVGCTLSGVTLTNCTIRGNTAYYQGAGVDCSDSSNSTFTNCTISGNATFAGAGVVCSSCNPTFTDCVISANTATVGGGLLCQDGASPALINCTIKGNTATYEGGGGGGVYCGPSSNPTFSNCTISANAAIWGGAVNCQSSSPTLTNCTIYGNSASPDGGGGAVNCWPSCTPVLTNCILWANTPQQFRLDSSTIVVTYCDVQGGYAGTGNLNLNPFFVNASSGNFRLTALSPCIDAGTNTPAGGLPDYDADGNPRVLDGNADGLAIVDMGAYELYRRGACSFAADGSCHYLMPFDCAVAGGAYQGDGTPCGPSDPTPPDAAIGVPVGADLDWGDAEGAASYDVHFGTVSPPPLVGNVTSAGWWLPPLASQTTYYWQVVVRGTGGTTAGPIWSFTTQSAVPSSPSNPRPGNGAVNVAIAADLDWADAPYATSYDVYFGTASPPPAVGTTASSSWPLGTLGYQTTYYWQVVAKNEVGTTAGPEWSFTTAPPYVPGDLNCDGRVDFDDINPFVACLVAGGCH